MDELKKLCKEINYYTHNIFITPWYYEKIIYTNALFSKMVRITELFYHYENYNTNQNSPYRTRKEFTPLELSSFNGSNGKPAYLAVDGVVYDVSNEASWGGGTHFGLYAGKILSKEFMDCHGNLAILSKLTKVGILKI